MSGRISAGEEAVVEWFADHEIAATPRTIAFELDLPHNSIKQHCMALHDYGFLARPEPPDGLTNTGVYRITDAGQRYVAGEMTLKELRQHTEE